MSLAIYGPLFSGDLKPCPFCGGSPAQDSGFADAGPYVVCNKCEAGGPARRTHIAAAKAWNRRKVILGRLPPDDMTLDPPPLG